MESQNQITPSPIETYASYKPKNPGFLRSKKLIVFFALFIIIGGAAAYLLTKYTVNTSIENVRQSQDISKKPAEKKQLPGTVLTQTPNTQWKTYTNKTNKFSIDFPARLQLKESAQGFGVTYVAVQNNESQTPNIPEYEILMFPKSVGKMIGLDFDEYFAFKNNTTKIIKDDQGSSQKLTKLQNRTIEKNKAFDFTSLSIPANLQEETTIGVYIEIGNTLIVISTAESNRTTFASMLESFKYPL